MMIDEVAMNGIMDKIRMMIENSEGDFEIRIYPSTVVGWNGNNDMQHEVVKLEFSVPIDSNSDQEQW